MVYLHAEGETGVEEKGDSSAWFMMLLIANSL